MRPYYYRGRKCGETIRYNDGLLIAVLNRLPPWPPSAEDPAVALDRALAAIAAQPPLKTDDFSGDSP